MAQKPPSILTPSAGSKENFHTPFASALGDEDKDKKPTIEGLEKALEENSAAQAEVLELFKSFYGETEAKSWYKQVKANYSQYSDDDRPIFKKLSGLEHDLRRLQNDLVLAKKRSEYSAMSLEDLTEVVVTIEARLQQSEAALAQRTSKLTGKHLLLVGGVTSRNLVTGQCISIDLETGEHIRPHDLHTARASPVVVAIGCRVYVAGGITSAVAGTGTTNWTQAFEVYDYVSHRWDTLANIPELVSGTKGCACGRNLIIWGNNSSGNIMVFMYDTSKRSWETMPSPPVALPTVTVPHIVNNKNIGNMTLSAHVPVFGCVGKSLFFFESRVCMTWSAVETCLSMYDLELPTPRWQQNDFFGNSNLHTLHHILRQKGVHETNHASANLACFFRGSELAFVNDQDLSMGGVFTYDSKTGFRAQLTGTWGKKLVAFANDLAIFRMTANNVNNHKAVPGSALNSFCIRIISSQVEKYLDFFYGDDFEDEKQIEKFTGVVVDTIEVPEPVSSHETSPSWLRTNQLQLFFATSGAESQDGMIGG